MSTQQPPSSARKPTTPWDRLRPVKQDPLEAMGYVSKGDTRLLDVKIQESFYQKIVSRYMQFCTRHKKDLDNAFASLSLSSDTSASSDATRNPPIADSRTPPKPNAASSASQGLSGSKWASDPIPSAPSPSPSNELSTILTALRKLREGLLATSSTAGSPVFSQRVHVFNVRVAILALHPPSYHPSLLYLLTVLHTKDHPLPDPELREMTTYMILDLALRQNDLVAARALKHKSKIQINYNDRSIGAILRAVVEGNWVAFWHIRREVDGYVRALMHWHTDTIRKQTLKTFARAYMKTDLKWLLESVGGNEMSWNELVAEEAIGWSLEGQTVVIRKPRSK